MKSTKRRKMFFLAILIVLAAGLFWRSFPFRIVDISGKKFVANLALTREEQRKGLGGRDRLCGRCAMLFDFKDKNKYSFWMKDMKFDLDIIWISDGRIVYIKKNFSRHSPETIAPDSYADKVLEINSGISSKFGFEIGDAVKIY